MRPGSVEANSHSPTLNASRLTLRISHSRRVMKTVNTETLNRKEKGLRLLSCIRLLADDD